MEYGTNLKIVFMGTPEFGAIILEGLIEKGFKPVSIITSPDKPVGRKQTITSPPTKISAQKHNIPVLQPEILADAKSQIINHKPDLIVVSAYNQIIPKEILDIPKYGCLDIHPSLLPKYRGPSPIQTAILNGDKKTGVTIILMDEKVDRGPILSQKTLVIDKKETSQTLLIKLADLGTRLLMETVSRWIKKMIKPLSQDESQATYSRILHKDDGKINWKRTADRLEKEIRAYFPWPGSYTFWKKLGKSIKIDILEARVLESTETVGYPVGKTLVVPQNEIGVQCGAGLIGKAGDFLVIEKMKMEGKKEMISEDFLRGHPDFIGTILK